jgi:hypothetical protein
MVPAVMMMMLLVWIIEVREVVQRKRRGRKRKGTARRIDKRRGDG